jgi:hypothetical protein
MIEKDLQLLQETHDTCTRIEERMDGWIDRLDRLEGVVFGDGTEKKPGIQHDVQVIKNRAKFWSKMGWLALGAVVTPTAAAACIAAVWLIKNVH